MTSSAVNTIRHQCCVVGGGPAGLMLGYLLARAGIDVVVLEKHKDFLRDFRGDTIHPSTLELMKELGVLDEFLQRPHQQLKHFKLKIAGESITIADFSKINAFCQYIAFMPQWDFLDFIADQANKYPSFHLLMECEAVDIIEEDGKVSGVKAKTSSGPLNILADLTIGADGRNSVLRNRAGFNVQNIGAPMDVIWMRVSKKPEYSTEYLGHVGQGSILITLDRGDYWQCAFVIPKGQFEKFKEHGIDYMRQKMVSKMPSLKDSINEIQDWNDCFLLTVTVDRLKKWWRPGFICIGDAAHAMSPIGGVGINLAIQDAVAAANELVPTLEGGKDVESALAKIQKRREFPTKMTQNFQVFVQNRIISNVINESDTESIPFPLRVLQTVTMLQRLPAHVIGLGIRQEHIQTPDIKNVKH
ncbi:MAG: FAD-dependent oxidoreductase [candidate division NC10 bacterium]|nr:FAD-dependent oxidoreductase [candidate division NC10 bacterium]